MDKVLKTDNYWRYCRQHLYKIKIMELRLRYDFRFKKIKELELEFDLDCNLLQKQHQYSSKELIQHDIDLYDLVVRHSDLLK